MTIRATAKRQVITALKANEIGERIVFAMVENPPYITDDDLRPLRLRES